MAPGVCYAHLNTTIVSVRVFFGVEYVKWVFLFKYNHCVGSSKDKIVSYEALLIFKYNHCVGSSFTLRTIEESLSYLNTTIVSVRVLFKNKNVVHIKNLNTTIVSVRAMGCP